MASLATPCTILIKPHTTNMTCLASTERWRAGGAAEVAGVAVALVTSLLKFSFVESGLAVGRPLTAAVRLPAPGFCPPVRCLRWIAKPCRI